MSGPARFWRAHCLMAGSVPRSPTARCSLSVVNPILLDRNENRFGPAPGCLEVLRGAEPELLFNYTRAFEQGSYSELSARLGRLHGVPEDRIILGYGCEDLLKQAVQHFLKPGGTILIPSASWWYYTAMADEVGGTTATYPLVEQEKSFVFDVEALLALKDVHAPGLVLVASPNNPTGNVLARADLLRILETYHDTPVLLDQAYFGLTCDETDDFASLVERHPNLLVLRTFSKLYALAGARIGYGIIGAGMADFRRFCGRNLGYNRISEQLAMAALDDPAYYRNIAAKAEADRQAFYRLFRSCAGCRVFASAANFILVKFPAATAPLLQQELLRRGLVVKFFTEPRFLGYARISLGTDLENALLREAVRETWPAIDAYGAAAGGVA